MIEWFETDESELNATQVAFLAVARSRIAAVEWSLLPGDSLVSVYSGLLSLGLDVTDGSLIFRTIRVDLGPDLMLMGPDGTGQLVKALRKGDAGVEAVAVRSPEVDASLAIEWLVREALRPIDLHVWAGRDYGHRRWLLSDTGQTLVWSDSSNDPRRGLGAPDSIERVWPPPG